MRTCEPMPRSHVHPVSRYRCRQSIGCVPQARRATGHGEPAECRTSRRSCARSFSFARAGVSSSTAAGRSYVVARRDILAAVDQAERHAAGEYAAPRGEIVATAPIVFGRLHVLPVVVEFLKAFPDIDVRLMLTDRVTNFIEDHVDVALRIGSLPDSSLIATRLGSVRSVVCASPAYLAAHRPAPVRPSDLATHACITFEGLMSPTVWKFFSGKAEISVPIRTRLAVNTAETAVDAAVEASGDAVPAIRSPARSGHALSRSSSTISSPSPHPSI